ncbi:hypothetical protein Q8F55_009185 [Vanrija albida]|uniref:Uncharacterized protein n=1 Tax=Vanrija albida TaxID=181172 RepID=A0ABR3PTT2_9TREE
MLRATARTLSKHGKARVPGPAAPRSAPAPSAASTPSPGWVPSTKLPKGAEEQAYVPPPAPTPRPTPQPARRRPAADPDAAARAKAEKVLQTRREAGARKTDRTRGLLDSFRALPANVQILVGLGFGIVGVAGLWWDSTYPAAGGAAGGEGSDAEAGEESKPAISVRLVDRK